MRLQNAEKLPLTHQRVIRLEPKRQDEYNRDKLVAGIFMNQKGKTRAFAFGIVYASGTSSPNLDHCICIEDWQEIIILIITCCPEPGLSSVTLKKYDGSKKVLCFSSWLTFFRVFSADDPALAHRPNSVFYQLFLLGQKHLRESMGCWKIWNKLL